MSKGEAPNDKELQAAYYCCNNLIDLDKDQRRRVLHYLVERFLGVEYRGTLKVVFPLDMEGDHEDV